MKRLLSFFVLLLILASCATMPNEQPLKNGDLLFVEAKSENLSGAISRVTSPKEISYDHIGIIEVVGKEIYVLHATTQGGTIQQTLSDFIKNHPHQRIAQYRLLEEYQKAIPGAIQQAHQHLGKPYNYSYILNDSTLYCSDFIERIFRNEKIFNLEPMTFINPKTGKIDDFWIRHYQQLNLDVPEGKLGCNPNGLSNSDKIKFIQFLKND